MRTIRRLSFSAVFLIGLAGCASSTDSADSWSESYFASVDRVFDAVIDVLEDDDYLIDEDRTTGRITAEPSRNSRGLSPSLAIKVVAKEERVLVDVQTRAGINDSVTRGSQIEVRIVEFFHELDLRLQGLKD